MHDEAYPGTTSGVSGSRHGVVHHLPIPDNDTVLVEALRAGRPGATAALFDRHAAHVRRVLVRVLGSDSEIPDLVHEVFVHVLESISRLQDPKALRGWITSIAVYTARGRIRKRKRARLLKFFDPSDLDSVASVPSSAEFSDAVRSTYRILSRLPTEERIAFALRFIEGMELTEVAAACRVSLATVKRRLARAQQQFLEQARQYPELSIWIEGGGRWSA